ncbi:hypothetical protein [Streptomyces aureocirculatus]|uniref:hypothetical protein n=1 Tax=Streptomyces aureocirculatus TaxID=67275 RepID=UPI0004C574F5|nr:hypothetical protein [Streptomyces aureocirculatus]
MTPERRKLRFPNDATVTMMFNPGENTLRAVADTGTVRAWDTTTGKARRTSYIGPVSGMVLSPDSHTLATGGSRYIDTKSGSRVMAT